MNVGELKKWLADKKDNATVEVVAHNRGYGNFSLCLGGGSDGGSDYSSVAFWVDELCLDNEQERATDNEKT